MVYRLASQAGLAPTQLVNPKSTAFKEKRIKPETLSDDQAAALISENPRIMFRPILSNGSTAVIGFDTGKMEKLLG